MTRPYFFSGSFLHGSVSLSQVGRFKPSGFQEGLKPHRGLMDAEVRPCGGLARPYGRDTKGLIEASWPYQALEAQDH